MSDTHTELMNCKATWLTTERRPLDAYSWRQLLRNEIALIVIPDFATREECTRLVRSAAKIGFELYDDVDPPIDRIGITVFEYDRLGAPKYFHDAKEAQAIQQAIFGRSFDPLQRLIRRISAVSEQPVRVATDPVLGLYHAGLVRRIEQGTLLHIDFAPAEQPTWLVAGVRSQVTWNLYLALSSATPGCTHVYNREWSPPDERLKIPDTYGYDHRVVDGAARITYEPTVGDVYLFNTRNFHRVDASAGRRITFGSAIGEFDDGRIVLWS